MTKLTQYRIYAGGNIVHQDDFEEYDNAQPYYDDYSEHTLPDALIDHIVGLVPKPVHIERSISGPESVELDDGKYTYINDNGHQTALRYGEPWQDKELTGNNFLSSMGEKIFTLRYELNVAQQENIALRNEIAIDGQPDEMTGAISQEPN